MKKRNVRTTKPRQRQSDQSRLRTYSLMLICGGLLLGGIFFAGRQHFSSMDYGMKNSRLRKQVDELQAEKRRLMLAREVSLSPAEIKKAAMRAGLAAPAGIEGMTAQVASATKEKAVPAAVPDGKPLIVKTAAVSPAVAKIDAVYSKTEKMDRRVKKPTSVD